MVSIFRPQAIWKVAVPASVVGTYLAVLFWIAGMTYTQTNIAALLNQTATVFIVILAALFLKEPLTVRKGLAVIVALGGSMLVLTQTNVG